MWIIGIIFAKEALTSLNNLIMNKKILILLIFSLSSSLFYSAKAQTTEKTTGGIKWLTLQQAEEAMKKKPKKMIVDVYTTWCYWCKVLDAKTYSDAKVIDYVNKNFYAVKLDAESKDSVTYQGKTYFYNSSYRVNGVTQQFMEGSNGYPTITIVDEKFKVVSVNPGYQDSDAFLKLMKYYGDNYYLNTDYNTYLKTVDTQ
jgi:thioredoxin-related protein